MSDKKQSSQFPSDSDQDFWRNNNQDINFRDDFERDLPKDTFEEKFVIPGIKENPRKKFSDSQDITYDLSPKNNFDIQKNSYPISEPSFLKNQSNNKFSNFEPNSQTNSDLNYEKLDNKNFDFKDSNGYLKNSLNDSDYSQRATFNYQDPNSKVSKNSSIASNNLDFEEPAEPTDNYEKDENKPKNIFGKIGGFLKKHRKAIRFLFLFFLVFGILGAGFVGIWAIGIYNSIGNVVDSATAISEGSIIYDRKNREMFTYAGDIHREKVSNEKIPENMKLAIVALEDENFYENQMGIPWQNLVGAIAKCGISRGRDCRGGSGLSQQLIKNVKQDDAATLDRKIRELFTAIKYLRSSNRYAKLLW